MDAILLQVASELTQLHGEMYLVGGSVRDQLLGLDSKDLDFVICKLSVEQVKCVLLQYGKIDLVGVSFGVIKFTYATSSDQAGEKKTVDIAFPRTERKTGQGETCKDVITTDTLLSIQDDLQRRDFTINSIARLALHSDTLIDPFGGLQDLKNKIVRCTNPVVFADDPLRMFRCIRFAVKLGFDVDTTTFELIQKNAHLVRSIPKTRILRELELIYSASSRQTSSVHTRGPQRGVKLLVESGLYYALFHCVHSGVYENFVNAFSSKGRDGRPHCGLRGDVVADRGTVSRLRRSEALIGAPPLRGTQSVPTGADGFPTTFSEFLYYLLEFTNTPDVYYKEFLQGKNHIAKELRALVMLSNNKELNLREQKHLLFSVCGISKSVLETNTAKIVLDKVLSDPCRITSLSDLKINGNDLLQLGYSGKEISTLLMRCVDAIFSGSVQNTKESLIKFCTPDM
jgi:tRNA nucleotidyltransferase/poly(A) polymerase